MNGFRLDPGSITLTDYLGSDADATNVHQLYTTLSGSTLTANLVGGTMDLTNLSNIVSSDSSTGKSPILSFNLNSIPAAGESGTATITINDSGLTILTKNRNILTIVVNILNVSTSSYRYCITTASCIDPGLN